MEKTKTFQEYIGWVQELMEEDPLLVRYLLTVEDERTKNLKAAVPQSNMVFILGADETASHRILRELGYQEGRLNKANMLFEKGSWNGQLFGDINNSSAFAAWGENSDKVKLYESDGILYQWGVNDGRIFTPDLPVQSYFQLNYPREDETKYDLEKFLTCYNFEDTINIGQGDIITIGEWVTRLGDRLLQKRGQVDRNLQALQKIVDEGIPALYKNAVSPTVLAYTGFEL